MKNIFRWLQLSDLHIFDSTEWNLMKKEYEIILKEKKIDFVIISGDLHQYNDDYSKTIKFLNNLVDFLGISKNDIFIIPGNHDVSNFKMKNLIVKDICERIENNEIDAYQEYLEELSSSYNTFRDFIRNFYGEEIREEYEQLISGTCVFNWRNSLNILALNSTLICDGSKNHKQILNTKMLSSITIDNNLPTIACAHHNVHDIFEPHIKVLTSVIRQNNVSAFICGDAHLFGHNPPLTPIWPKNTEYIICGKSAIEPNDSYSQVGFMLFEWQQGKDCQCTTYKWDNTHQSRFEPCHWLENVPGVLNKFPMQTQNVIQHKKANSILESHGKKSKYWSIWLPDAEQATGEQTRFKNFTVTNSIADFLNEDSAYWGIASVKGIGKTFLLQVKRVQLTQSSICVPYFKTPSKNNNWATEAVKFDAQKLLNLNMTQDQMVKLWKYVLICYIEQTWISIQNQLSKSRRCASYDDILNRITQALKSRGISEKTYQYLTNDSYTKLELIIKDVLKQDSWATQISNDYDFLHMLGQKICNAISRNKKNTITLFLDKLDQSLKQPNSEESLDCAICSKSTMMNSCIHPRKGTKYCYDIDGDICPNKFQCCYGCEMYIDEYAGSNMRIYHSRAKKSIQHINYWQRLQLALIEAVNEIKMDFDGNIKVIYTVRSESFNCEADILGSNRSKILSLTKTLNYTRDEHRSIYIDCIKNQNPDLLVYPEKASKPGHEEEAFVGVSSICHPYVMDATESIFDIIYRHSFDRSRDIQYYGQALTNGIEKIRNAALSERGTVVKEIIEETAAVLAYNYDKSTHSTEYSYYFEKIPNMPSYWADATNFESLLHLIDRNLLFEEDMRLICQQINSCCKCETQCSGCSHHPFSMLYNLGMLGYVSINENGIDNVKQVFLDAQKITYFHEESALPLNKHTLYVIHPALTKSVEAVKKDKIMHFNGFLLGKEILVKQDKIASILQDKYQLTKQQFEEKYYKKIKD